MPIVRRISKLALLSLAAAGMGGSIGGVIIALATFAQVPDPGAYFSHPLGFVGVIAISSVAAGYGFAFGIILGFAPTLVLSGILSALSGRRMFAWLLLWAVAGAVAGLAIGWIDPFGLGKGRSARGEIEFIWLWVIGGAAAMSSYWLLENRIFGPLPDRQLSRVDG